MNLRMAVRTPGIEQGPVFALGGYGRCLMPDVALHAEERLLRNQQIVVRRAVRKMTAAAVLHEVGMLKRKWPFIFSVTFCTGVLDRLFPQQHLVFRSMLIMAVRAEEPAFINWMAAPEGEFRPRPDVACIADVFHIAGRDDQVSALMDIMAIYAGYILRRMGADIPVMQVKSRVSGMAAQAEQRLGGWRKVSYIDERIKIARGLLALSGVFGHLFRGKAFNGKAAGAVTGLAVHHRHA